MKYLLFLTLLISCTKKYQTYPVIDKNNFDMQNYQSPVTPKLKRGDKTTLKHCEGQVFWMSNAKARTDLYIERAINSICAEESYLLDSKITETWWTLIFYSRSCIKLEGYCSR